MISDAEFCVGYNEWKGTKSKPFKQPYTDDITSIFIEWPYQHEMLQRIWNMSYGEVAAEEDTHQYMINNISGYDNSEYAKMKQKIINMRKNYLAMETNQEQPTYSLVGGFLNFLGWYRNEIRHHMVDTIIIDEYHNRGGRLF
jgi:hypothetical protein